MNKIKALEEKIKISKEELEELYIEKFLSQKDIAKLYFTTATTICRLMKKYQIPVRPPIESNPCVFKLSDIQINDIWHLYNSGMNRDDIADKLGFPPWAVRKQIQGKTRIPGESLKLYYKNSTIPLTYDQNQLILGSLLGDAYIGFKSIGERYEFTVGHCLEQKEYLGYKASILGSNVRSYIKDSESYSAGKEFFITSYSNKYELQKIHKMCTLNGVKRVSQEWANLIDAKGIAIWFMDDGTSSFTKTDFIACRFSTLSFTKDELIILQKRLLDFDIHTTLQSHEDGLGLIISVRQCSLNKFMNLIDPYVIDCMRYKIKKRKSESNYKFIPKNKRCPDCIL